MELKRLKLVGKEEDCIEVREEDIVVPEWEGFSRCDEPQIDKRRQGDFRNKGFYLSPYYHWIIGEDDLGHSVLLALRKKP